MGNITSRWYRTVLVLLPISLLFRLINLLLTVIILLFLLRAILPYLNHADHYAATHYIVNFTEPYIIILKSYIPTKFKGYELASWIIIILMLCIKYWINRIIRFIARQRSYARSRSATDLSAYYSSTEDALAAKRTLFKSDKDSRDVLLKQFIEVKKKLEEAQKNLAFLSIDVVGSTKMKAGEEKAMIEYSFSAYKKFVDSILMANKAWKVAWTPDGIMCAFWSVDDAVKASTTLIQGLAHFNKESNQMKTPFEVRCGINDGKVMFDLTAPMEEVSDEAIDVAGHLQKYAPPNAVWISAKTFQQLQDKSNFYAIDKTVDNHPVYQWQG